MVRFHPPKSHDTFCPPISRFPTKAANANLRFSAVSCENPRFSAKSRVSQMLCFPGKSGRLIFYHYGC